MRTPEEIEDLAPECELYRKYVAKAAEDGDMVLFDRLSNTLLKYVQAYTRQRLISSDVLSRESLMLWVGQSLLPGIQETLKEANVEDYGGLVDRLRARLFGSIEQLTNGTGAPRLEFK